MSPPILDPIRGALLRTQPDARLVGLAREGRERAFEEIVRRYRAPLVAFAAMFVPAHRADDVVQESLLRAFDALRSSDAEIQLRPWLFRIVRNQALNDLRDTPAHDELTEELDGVASPPEIAERREEVAAIMGGLQALPEAQREAIVARELEGRGHAEIAAELGTSTGAVRQLIFRARTTLRGAAGLLIPLPLLRFLLGPGGSEAASAATGAGVAAATAGGGGVAGKVAVGLAGVAIAVGGGVAAERNRDDAGDRIASANEVEEDDGGSGASGSSGSGHGADTAGSSGPGGGGTGGSSGPGPGDDDSGHRSGDRSGHGGGEHEGGDDSSGPGSSGSGHDGSSGPGSSGSGSSGSGSGDDLAEIDNSGPSGSSGSGSSGSGSSGSGSSGSGTSGSGSSGSGPTGSGSSGSGSSGSGISGSGASGSGTSGSGSSGSGSSGGGGDPDVLDDGLD